MNQVKLLHLAWPASKFAGRLLQAHVFLSLLAICCYAWLLYKILYSLPRPLVCVAQECCDIADEYGRFTPSPGRSIVTSLLMCRFRRRILTILFCWVRWGLQAASISDAIQASRCKQCDAMPQCGSGFPAYSLQTLHLSMLCQPQLR